MRLSNMQRFWIAFLLCLLVCICRLSAEHRRGEGVQTQASPFAAKIDEFIFGSFRDIRETYQTRADFERRFGKPISVRKRPFITQNGDHDTVYELVFRGIRVDLYESAESQRVSLYGVLVTDNRWNIPSVGTLHIGSTKQDLLMLLGKPDTNKNTEWKYQCNACLGDENVTFTFSGERIRSIHWEFDLD